MDLTRDQAARLWAGLRPALKERVRRGAALFDSRTRRAKGGKRWPDRIDLAKLDMSVGYPDEGHRGEDCGCVCKQLFGSYDNATERLDVGITGGAYFGFVASEESYATLDKAWAALITMEREDAS